MPSDSSKKRGREPPTEISPVQVSKKPITNINMALTKQDLQDLRVNIKQDLQNELQPLLNRIINLELSVNQIEAKSREKNIIIHGIKECDNESFEVLNKTMEEFWAALGLTDILIDNTFRVGKPKLAVNRPIIVILKSM